MNSSVTRLRCEYLCDPLGIDERRPRLSWVMESERRGARQVAFRVQVASSADKLDRGEADLWDSGRVESDRSTHVEYDGTPLISRQTCHWQVTLWDETGTAAISEPALWTMGLLESVDWQARWITHDPEIIRRDEDAIESTDTEPGTVPLFRRNFAVEKPVRRATIYVTACGLVDLVLNGKPVTADRFVPEWTDYHKRLHYRTFDVTELVAEGKNVLGALLGDGWWSGYIGWQETRGQYGTLVNSFFLQLEVELADGTIERIVSDDGWRCETGPILASDFMMGETYDARRERTGWDVAGFDDVDWLAAVEVEPPRQRVPKYGFSCNQPAVLDEPLALVAQRSEPVRVVESLRPVSVSEVSPGAFVYDLGQNITGWVRIELSGAAGTRFQIRHAERLNPDGTIYTENLRRARATDVTIFRGKERETYEPRFTFHGFQYIEITGLDQALPLDKITGQVAMSATPPAGEFECSDPLVNRLWQNIVWGQKGNFLTVPTDCPQRDERLGWMGDAQVFCRTASYNMDVAAFFTKWMTDVCDSQDADGVFPDVAPRIREAENFVGLDGLGGGAGWADAGVIVPWTMWRMYDDRRLVERHWDAMVRWLDWLDRSNPEGIRCHSLGNNYGDWLCIPTDTSFRAQSPMKTLLATAYWADDAAKMAQMARALGKQADAERFEAMFARVRDAFQNEWLLDDGRLAVETQTAYLLALAFNLLPEELRSRAAEHLVESIRALDWHLSTGFIGISHLNPQLTLAGFANVAYWLLGNRDYPSWLYPVLHGATTIWERWNGWTEEEGFFNPQMNSFNHYSLGSVGEWLYRHVAGMELADDENGFKRFVVKPYLGSLFTHAGASYRSHNGKIESRWELMENQLRLSVVIPPNASATVYVPCDEGAQILEAALPADQAEGLELLGREKGYTAFAAAAGRYVFSTTLTIQEN